MISTCLRTAKLSVASIRQTLRRTARLGCGHSRSGTTKVATQRTGMLRPETPPPWQPSPRAGGANERINALSPTCPRECRFLEQHIVYHNGKVLYLIKYRDCGHTDGFCTIECKRSYLAAFGDCAPDFRIACDHPAYGLPSIFGTRPAIFRVINRPWRLESTALRLNGLASRLFRSYYLPI
jgi:hypothetical protein